jgi:uncharacterized phage infection (PIP) family protein YhgE
MSEKLDAVLTLTAGVVSALNAAKELQKHDPRAKQLVTGLQRIKNKALPIIQEEADRLSKEDEEFNSFSNSKSDWIEGRR